MRARRTGVVSRVLCSAPGGGRDHLSGTRIAPGLWRPTRDSFGTGGPMVPYLALLRMGFAVRLLLPGARCALTAPFHPCLCPGKTRAIGGLLSAALSVTSRCPGVTRHPALWSSDFPPLGEFPGTPGGDPSARPPGRAPKFTPQDCRGQSGPGGAQWPAPAFRPAGDSLPERPAASALATPAPATRGARAGSPADPAVARPRRETC